MSKKKCPYQTIGPFFKNDRIERSIYPYFIIYSSSGEIMKSKIGLILLLTLFFSISCAHQSAESSIVKVTHLKLPPSTQLAGTTISGQNIYLGGFSGLSFSKNESDNLIFQTITDRGPNGFPEGSERPFLLPEFSPQIITLKVNSSKNTLEVVNQMKLKKKDGKDLSGLPNHRDKENPVDPFGIMCSIDPNGLDTESIVKDSEGGYWIGEEYSPSLVHFDAQGVMTRRLTPGNELPKIYLEGIPNRGFEGIALINNRLWGFLQSPLLVDKNISRIVEVDLDSMKTSAEYFYPFEKGNDKIGDAVAIDKNSFLVIEQNGKRGSESSKLIFKITLDKSDTNVNKALVADLKNTPFNNIEKIEGIALINRHQIALVNDNDFQIKGKTNYQTGITPLNDEANQMLILDLKEDL